VDQLLTQNGEWRGAARFVAREAQCLHSAGPRDASAGESEASWAASVDLEVRALAAAIAADLAREGPEAWLRHFDEGPSFFMASDGVAKFPSYDSMREFVLRFDPGISAMELSWSDVRVEALTPTLASLGAAYRESITYTSGKEVRFGGYFTGLAARTQTGWKLRNAHWSSEVDR
jgi:hypothetical protein